jgi:predicted phosphodiesterase
VPLKRHSAQSCYFSVNIAVISDLHLGSEDVTDSFGHEDSDFLRFLSFLEENFERVVLLGDIWETLTTRCPWRARSGLREARARHPEIAKRFSDPKYKYIHGNHDFIAAEVDGAPEHWALEADGKRLLFMHGHGHDRLIRVARHLVELGVCIGGWIRRVGLHRAYHYLYHLEQARFGANADAEDCSFRCWALGVAAEAGADIVVTGHTHLPSVSQHDSRVFSNSGSCSRGRFNFLALDTRADVYAVHQSF